MKNQKTKGILLSYLNIVLSMCVNIFLIPMMISVLSDNEYSIYKVMQSFAGPLIMFNMGISTIAARCIAKHKIVGDEKKKEKENTLALILIISLAMALVVIICGLVMTQLIPYVFSRTFTESELVLSKKIFLVFMFSTAVQIVNDTFRGCVQGNEKFVCFYATKTFHYIVRFGAIVVLLSLGCGALAVSMVDLVIAVLILLFNIFYCFFGLKERFKFHYIDKKELYDIAAFSFAILMQAIINQVNNNMDTVILGAMVVDREVITMYSSALSIYAIYNSMISVFVSVFLPKATHMIYQGKSGEELTDFVIKPGRVQAFIAMAVVCCFALFGKDFITLWIGEKYIHAYYVVLMLIIPVSIPLIQNVCLSILDAMMKRTFRSIVLGVMAFINVLLSVLLVKQMGFWGAAVGTVVSLIIGHVILMNIYYWKVIKLNVIRMFKEIFAGILPMGIVAMILCAGLNYLIGTSIPGFIIKCGCFVCLYSLLVWKKGMNDDERIAVKGFRRKR